MEIRVENLTKKYDKNVVIDSLSMNIPSGSIYGFIGPNGAGKTTTMRMMIGLLNGNGGTTYYDGKDITLDKNELLKNIGVFISRPSYYGNLTAYENLSYIQKVLDKPIKEVDRVLNLVELINAKDKLVKKYSLGMKQRLGLAFAFLNDPEVLILDEPTNGLDPRGIHDMRELLVNLSKNCGKTILISSHNISEIEMIADDICIINHGKKVFEGSLPSLFNIKGINYGLRVDKIEKTKKVLVENKISYKMNNSLFEIEINREFVPELIKLLIKRDIKTYEIAPNKNLEDIFLRITGEE